MGNPFNLGSKTINIKYVRISATVLFVIFSAMILYIVLRNKGKKRP